MFEPVFGALMREIIIPPNPTPADIERLLIECVEAIDEAADYLTRQRAEMADLKFRRDAAFSRALIDNRDRGNASIVKAYAELDRDVSDFTRRVIEKQMSVELAQDRKDDAENSFITLRKLADLVKSQIERLHV